MTVKIAILKSGENILCDIKEGYDDDKLITYFLENPCTIKLNGRYSITDDNGDQQNQMSVALHPWPSFSKDTSVAIPIDWLVTIVEPISGIKKMYEDQFKNDETISATEQSDPGLAD